jgi:uncharacterized protein YpmS
LVYPKLVKYPHRLSLDNLPRLNRLPLRLLIQVGLVLVVIWAIYQAILAVATKMIKAQFALNLLNDEFFIGEISAIKQNYINEIVNSSPSDYEERENAYKFILAINKLMGHFEALAAQKQIDHSRLKIF